MARQISKSKAKWISLVVALATSRAMADSAAVRPVAAQPSTEPQTVRRIIVSVPDRKLALIENGETKKVYSVAVGAAVSASPSGSFKIVNRVANPTYYHPGTVIAPGPANPLGTRWMGLDRKGYGIHGTNQPKSIGKAASHGCIRMARHDLEELFNLARVGDTVEIHGERDETVAAIFGGQVAVAIAQAAVESVSADEQK